MASKTMPKRRLIMLPAVQGEGEDTSGQQELARRVDDLERRLDESPPPVAAPGPNGNGRGRTPSRPSGLGRVQEAVEERLRNIVD